MAVIYLFDHTRQLKKPVREGVQEIIHMEGEYEAVAQILAKDAPANGEYFGFRCMDKRFRLFLIRLVEINDESSTCMITGTDAAIAELDTSIVTELSLQNTTAVKAITSALQGTDWTIGQQTGNGQVNTESAYFATRWAAIKTAAAAGGVRAVPYYEFGGNRITAKRVDVLDKTPVFSGLIYTRRRGAQNIHITKEGIPYGRVYPIGKIIGTEDPPEQVTIADAVWSKANGNPADKPAGQLWVALPGAISDAEYVFEDKKEENPTRLLEKAFADMEKTNRPIASGTANISEMERIPGYEHMTAQMWMMAVVRSEYGESVETTITNIERYYVHTELTRITVGDEKSNADMLENMLASMRMELMDTARVAGGGRAGAGKAKQMVLEAEELIQLNSDRIELNAKEINLRAFEAEVLRLEDETEVHFQEVYLDINADRAEISATNTKVDNLGNEVSGINATLIVQAGQIAAKASQFDVNALGNRVTTAESELVVQAGQIAAKASQFDVNALGNRVTTAEGKLTVQAGQIAAKASLNAVDELKNRVETAESELTVQAGEIALKASKYIVEGLEGRVTTAESRIKVQANEISTKVSKDGVISSINQTAEQIKIQAKKINLSGYVTADQFEAEMAVIENIFAGYSEISSLGISGNLYAANANFTKNLRLFEHYTVWQEVELFKGGRIGISSTTSAVVWDNNGNPIGKVNGIPSGFIFTPSSQGTYYFLGQA